MTFKHLSENPRQQARAWNIALGVPGFRYADLTGVRGLGALDRAFLEWLRGEDAGLASAFETWRADGGLEELAESKLLMEVAPHLGRFVARLFHVESEHEALCARVRADQVLFQDRKSVV